ncbi:histidine phosphatase family protein [Klebsiella oxytoca]|uniref:histidine phosphatase family protein n=1 Tax=Klebsiella oxytoca TaxID=571 RepID=UPI003570B7F7
MKIVLVRHGKPNVDMKTRVSPGEMFSWIQTYDDSKVNESCPTPLLDSISVDDFLIVSSPLPRALASLDIIGVEPAMIDSVFHEAHLPMLNISRPKLSPLTNVFLLRVLWLMGYDKDVESYRLAKLRSASAAARLITLAENYSSVLLMGHGIINRMIGSQLKRQGFGKIEVIGKSYWQADVYET